ncbi:MAG: M61 family metallopeptidase [Mongoliitalea sp.]
MHYHIQRKAITSQFIQVSLFISVIKGEILKLQLAAWRPGRYELANYAQNIRFFQATQTGKPIPFKKISKDCWEIFPSSSHEVLIEYEYFCNQMDAGGSWSDDEQLYLNFSNFAFDLLGRSEENITIDLDIPSDYRIACALPLDGTMLKAENYQELMDSPLIASPNLQQFSYQIGASLFKVWIQGEIYFDIADFLLILKNFSQTQIQSFGDFPAETYHFMYQLLPYKHYHGVEHRFSTVITFGPDESLQETQQIQELIGVSSHELYHFWNVCRIRPRGISPYDLSKEVYLEEGLVLEGVTTYMGDLMLLKSGYFSLEQYLNELGRQIQKESEGFGWRNQSIAESSLDLWLDGYKAGIPHKKVNIYNRGALISFCLDVCLVENGSSLQALMRKLWKAYGKDSHGYRWMEFLDVLRDYGNPSTDVEQIIQELILGKKDIIPFLNYALAKIGVNLCENYQNDPLRHQAGIIVDSSQSIVNIHPDSSAIHVCMLKDQLLDWNMNQKSKKIYATVLRYGRRLTLEIPVNKKAYFPIWKLNISNATTLRNHWKKIN